MQYVVTNTEIFSMQDDYECSVFCSFNQTLPIYEAGAVATTMRKKVLLLSDTTFDGDGPNFLSGDRPLRTSFADATLIKIEFFPSILCMNFPQFPFFA